LFAAAFLLRFLAKSVDFQAQKSGHENRILAVRNTEARGSIPLCSTKKPTAIKYLKQQSEQPSFLLVTPL